MKLNELKQKKSLNPLYVLERKLNLKPLIIFTIVAAVLTIIFTLLFNFATKMRDQLLELFKDNKDIYESLNSMLATNDLGSYFVMQASQVWGFVGVIYAMFLGCKLVSGNLKDNSYEMLYSLELSRNKIIKTKFLRLILNVLIFNVVVGICGFVAIAIVGINKINVLNFLLYFIITILVCIQTGALSFALALIFKRKYSVVLSVVVAVVLFFVANFALMGSNFAFLEYITPLNGLFESVISGGIKELNYISLIIWTVLPAAFMFVGIQKFNKTDLI